MSSLKEIVMGRKSVRTFDGKALSEEHRKDLEEYIREIPNPFDIPVTFALLDAKENDLSSPVLAGEPMYVAGKVEKRDYADVAFGYSAEKLVLHAWELGIGTVLIGGTMKREVFEAAVGLQSGEKMPCISPLGYPAAKRSLKETMMRKGIGADTRLSADKLFFKDQWGKALNPDDQTAALLELVRWAPSAVNRQPWRLIFADGLVHFYERKDKGFDNPESGDMQKIDLGIALAHFCMGLEEQGKKPEVLIRNPGLEVPANAEYIASVRV